MNGAVTITRISIFSHSFQNKSGRSWNDLHFSFDFQNTQQEKGIEESCAVTEQEEDMKRKINK